jgi:polyphosphate kinase 2 (PPK2 family)
MGFCTDKESWEFMHASPEFERMLVRDGIILRKYWFSVSDAEQERRFQKRSSDPKRRGKLSPTDLKSRYVGRVLAGQGRDVPLHAHARGALVHGRVR